MDREDRLDYRSSLVAAFVANVAPRSKKDKRKVLQPQDIIKPIRDRESSSSSDEETLDVLSEDQQLNALEYQFGPVVDFESLPPGLR